MIAQRTIISGLLDWHSQSFHWMKVFWVQMIDLDLFLKGCCHGNWFCGENGKLPSFVALALWNGIGYCYLNVRIKSVNDASIWSKNFVNFVTVTPELTELICELLVRHGKKLAYSVECLEIYWTDFRNLFAIRKRFGCRWSICTLFSDLSREVAMATK